MIEDVRGARWLSCLLLFVGACAKPSPESPASARSAEPAPSAEAEPAPTPASTVPPQTADGNEKALLQACADVPRKSVEEGACKALLMAMMGLSPEANHSQTKHDQRLQACEQKSSCVDLALDAYWGVPPFTRPSVEDSLRYAHQECATQTADSDACSLERVLLRARSFLAPSS